MRLGLYRGFCWPRVGFVHVRDAAQARCGVTEDSLDDNERAKLAERVGFEPDTIQWNL